MRGVNLDGSAKQPKIQKSSDPERLLTRTSTGESVKVAIEGNTSAIQAIR